ncbi:MAG: FkbM family methyltransferase [Holosporaceae bacterium]|nr:FkbM family methyltransferase [Holosporaceae bacterium]
MIDFSENSEKRGFFSRNRIVSLAIIIACLLFVIIFFIEKSKVFVDMVPIIRGEISLDGGFSITLIKNRYPILIKKDDPIVGSRLRFSGDIKSIFSETSLLLAPNHGVIAEVGSHFGYNAINIAKKMGDLSRYYTFEPNSKVFSCFLKSIVLNDLDKIVCPKNVAISDSVSSIAINDCLSTAKNVYETHAKQRAIIVNSSTLDEELKNEQMPVSFLMIDIPGSEFLILRGAKKIIEKSPDIKIVLSFSRKNSLKNTDVRLELQKIKELGFVFYVVEGLGNLVLANIDDILSKDEVVVVMTRNKLILDY